MRQDFIRPRLVLATTPLPDGPTGLEALRAAIGAGDVASVLVDPAGRAEAAFQLFAEPIVTLCRDHEVAVLVCDDTRCAGRSGADGIHVSTGEIETLREAMARFAPRSIVGAGGFATRHEALIAGEALPDYMMFGDLGADDAPAPRSQDLALAEWWAEIVEVPCILLAGADVETLAQAIGTGAEFVALSRAVFADPRPEIVAAVVERANAILDEVSESLAK